MEYELTRHNAQSVIDKIMGELEGETHLLIKTSSAKSGKWGMARLWRSWVATASEFMAKNKVTMPLMIKKDGSFHGERPFNAADGHELFTMHMMGCDKDGNRLSWAKSPHPHGGMRIASQGERFNALRALEDWCLEKGVILKKPRDSEYEKLKHEQLPENQE